MIIYKNTHYNQSAKVRYGKSLPPLRGGSLPFTRPRAATPSELLRSDFPLEEYFWLYFKLSCLLLLSFWAPFILFWTTQPVILSGSEESVASYRLFAQILHSVQDDRKKQLRTIGWLCLLQNEICLYDLSRKRMGRGQFLDRIDIVNKVSYTYLCMIFRTDI